MELSTSLILKNIIYALRNVLDIDAVMPAGQASGEWLDPDANMLIDEHAAFGIADDLTAQEIADGIIEVDKAIYLIENSPSELEISVETLAALDLTVNEMRSELADAQ